MVQRTRGEAKEEKGQNGGKKGTLATEHKIRKSLKPEGGEGGEARRGERASEMVTVHTYEAKRGSFNAFLWVRVWVLGEAHCFQG